MEAFSPLREWDIFDQCYQRIGDSVTDAQRIGEKILEHCLAMPISRPPNSPDSREIVTGSGLFSQWHHEHSFPNTCSSIRWEEIPPEVTEPE
jgi:hypothetical protein